MRKIILITLILLATITVATAHDWYPYICCGGQGCHPVPCDQLVERGDGTWIWNNLIFSTEQVKSSLDQFCHVCINTQGQPLCAFTIQGS